jgi:lipoprotein-releasing system ATP-binding protein
LLEATNIHKAYTDIKKPISVLKGINLKIVEGEFAAIVGPSGAGKSTLLHILGGLDSPTSGSVSLEGENIYSLNDGQLADLRNKKIGFVFQFYHLLPEFTLLENVLLPGLIKNAKSAAIMDRAKHLLKQAGLDDRLEHFPSQLSGGERQRAAVVRSLINNPKLLLCDEPTGNLDSKAGEGIVSLIKKISKEIRMSVVLVTHNMDLAGLADRIYHLNDGVLVS